MAWAQAVRDNHLAHVRDAKRPGESESRVRVTLESSPDAADWMRTRREQAIQSEALGFAAWTSATSATTTRLKKSHHPAGKFQPVWLRYGQLACLLHAGGTARQYPDWPYGDVLRMRSQQRKREKALVSGQDGRAGQARWLNSTVRSPMAPPVEQAVARSERSGWLMFPGDP